MLYSGESSSTDSALNGTIEREREEEGQERGKRSGEKDDSRTLWVLVSTKSIQKLNDGLPACFTPRKASQIPLRSHPSLQAPSPVPIPI